MVRRLLVATLVILAGCGGTVDATVRERPTVTVQPPTATAVPATATATAAPTRTPQPKAAPATATVPAATPTPTVERMLASIERGAVLAPDDPAVAAYRRSLDALAPHCRDSRAELASAAIATRQLLAQKGVQEGALSILINVAASVPADSPPMPCAELFAAYATLRTGGR